MIIKLVTNGHFAAEDKRTTDFSGRAAVEITSLEEYKEFTEKDHTAGTYNKGYRHGDNFQFTECMMADIDNTHSENPEEWLNEQMVRDAFPEIALAISPSKNHMKDKPKKNGTIESARPRLHIHFPVPKREGQEGLEQYKKNYHTLMDRFPDMHFDPACSDATRYIHGHGGLSGPFVFQEGEAITSKLRGRPKKEGGPAPKIKWADLMLDEQAENPELLPPEVNRHDVYASVTMFWANQGKNETEISALLYAYNSKVPVPKDTDEAKVIAEFKGLVTSAIKKVQKNGGPDPDAHLNKIRNFYFKKTDKGPVTTAIRSTTRAMRVAMKHFVSMSYKGSNPALMLRKSPEVTIGKSSTLSAVLETVGFAMDIRSVQGALTKDDILERFRLESEKVWRLTCVPEHEMENGTLYVPQIVFPEPQETGALKDFLNIFTFKKEKDRHRFAAAVLSLYLPGSFDGKIPMCALLADGQNAGKSTVITETIRLLTGLNPLRQSGSKDKHASDLAQFSGPIGLASRAVLFDNLLKLKPDEETMISVAISEPDRDAWVMHISHTQIRNSFQYFATFNDSEGFRPDLQERIMAVRMTDPSEVSAEDRLAISEKVEEAFKNRDAIISDLRFLTALNAGESLPEFTPMEKFVVWAKRILPALHHMYPEVEHFDFSASDVDHRIDPRAEIFEEFIDHMFMTTDFVTYLPLGGGRAIRLRSKELFEQFALFSPEGARSFTMTSFSAAFRESMRSFEKGKVSKVKVRGQRLYEIQIPDHIYEEIKELQDEHEKERKHQEKLRDNYDKKLKKDFANELAEGENRPKPSRY